MVLVLKDSELRLKFIGVKVEVNIGDRSIEGVIKDINGVWVWLKGKLASKEGEYEFLVPICSIKYVRKVEPVSQGTP